MKSSEPNISKIAALVAAGIMSAAAAAWLLHALATPPRASLRLALLDREVSRTEEAARTITSTGLDPASLCRAPPEQITASMSGRLRGQAAQVQLALVSLNVTTQPPTHSNGGLPETMTFELAGTGRYDAVVRFVASLSSMRPNLYLDAVDLQSRLTEASLKVRGRFLCYA